MAGRSLRAAIGAVFGLVLMAGPAQAEVSAAATYTVTLGGTAIANVTVKLDESGGRYTMSLEARIAGLATFVASGTAKAASAGRTTGGELASEAFDLSTRAEGEDFKVRVEYASRDVTAFVVDPPIINNAGRIALERRHLTGVNDMLAAFVLKGRGLDRSLCDRTLRIFTGLERFNLAFRFVGDDEATSKRTGYQGPVVTCGIRYTPVSGHYTTSDVTTYLAESERILLWYAPLGSSGYYIPYRALLATGAGDLSVVLTELR